MSYEDKNCPCGGEKEPGTFLCHDCEAYLADRPELKIVKQSDLDPSTRRQSALICLALVKKRPGRPVRFSLAATKPSRKRKQK